MGETAEQVDSDDVNLSVFRHLLVDGHADKWYITWPDGSAFMGPYKLARTAKSELTKLKKGK